MARRAARLPLLTSFQRQASTVLAAVTKEIRQREQEIAALKAEAARWQSLLREPTGGKGPSAPTPRKRGADMTSAVNSGSAGGSKNSSPSPPRSRRAGASNADGGSR